MFFIPSIASAQPPAVEIRTAFGASHYLHGDLGYTAPAWLVAARFGAGGFAVEPEFVIARHEDRQLFGPSGGSGQTTATTIDRFQSAAVNVLGRWGTSVSAFAGVGAGLYWERHRYELIANGGGYAQDSTRGPRPGAQLVAGVDVPIVSRVRAFGEFRYEMRSFDDPGGGSVVQGFAGAAIAVK